MALLRATSKLGNKHTVGRSILISTFKSPHVRLGGYSCNHENTRALCTISRIQSHQSSDNKDDIYFKNNCTVPDVNSFFKGRSVFITGTTGFIGKVFLEKLLRSCPGIDKVFVLVRNMPDASAESRFQQIIEKSPLFERVLSECPSVLEKVEMIPGDLRYPNLGLSVTAVSSLNERVSVVFHVGASVRINQPLRDILEYNLEGTVNLAELARRMPLLKAFVHVSTAYSSCDREIIGEEVYPSSIKPIDMLHLLRSLEKTDFEAIASKLTSSYPNNYVFSKRITENFLVDHCSDLPLAIVRPPLTSASWKEPFPGWMDCKTGFLGYSAVISAGKVRVVQSTKLHLEVIPVDVVVNHIIAAAWDIAQNRRSEIPVYNSVSTAMNPITHEDMVMMVYRAALLHPIGTAQLPKPIVTGKRTTYKLLTWIYDYVPATAFDVAKIMNGEKPNVLKSIRRIKSVIDAGRFATKKLEFKCDNLLDLQNKLSSADKETFNLRIDALEWPEYFKNFLLGMKQYIINQKGDARM